MPNKKPTKNKNGEIIFEELKETEYKDFKPINTREIF